MTESEIDGTAAASPSKPSVRPARQDRTTIVLLLVAAFVAVGGIGFALGHLTAPGATGAANATGRGGFAGRDLPSLAPGQTFNPGEFGGAAGGRTNLGGLGGGITGTVQSISGTTMTIQEANGTSVTIDLSGSTTYHSETSASSSDVKIGTSVTVQVDAGALASKSPNPDASGALGGRTLTAKDVLITNP